MRQELLAKQAGLDRDHVKIDVVQKPAGSAAQALKTNNPLRMQTKLYVHNEVSNSPEFIELDLVVHGIDYADLSAQRQRAFLSEFAAAVRSGLVAPPDKTIKHLTAVKVMIDLEDQLREDTIQNDVKSSLQLIKALSLVTTWTPEAIHVSEPGEMNDFAGDLAFSADQQ